MELTMFIDRLEGDNAVLKSKDGNTVIWPKKLLPLGAHEGMALNFRILDEKQAEELQKTKAKDILNEIINME